MTRVNVTTGHFDIDKAERIDEATYWDGNNLISVHTRSNFYHQALYRTAGGRWVLNAWSQWQNVRETYDFIDDASAEAWLLLNDSDDVLTKYFGEIEEERGPGRPTIGGLVKVRLGDDLLGKVDALCATTGVSRPDYIRRVIEDAVAAHQAVAPGTGQRKDAA